MRKILTNYRNEKNVNILISSFNHLEDISEFLNTASFFWDLIIISWSKFSFFCCNFIRGHSVHGDGELRTEYHHPGQYHCHQCVLCEDVEPTDQYQCCQSQQCRQIRLPNCLLPMMHCLPAEIKNIKTESMACSGHLYYIQAGHNTGSNWNWKLKRKKLETRSYPSFLFVGSFEIVLSLQMVIVIFSGESNFNCLSFHNASISHP